MYSVFTERICSYMYKTQHIAQRTDVLSLERYALSKYAETLLPTFFIILSYPLTARYLMWKPDFRKYAKIAGRKNSKCVFIIYSNYKTRRTDLNQVSFDWIPQLFVILRLFFSPPSLSLLIKRQTAHITREYEQRETNFHICTCWYVS